MKNSIPNEKKRSLIASIPRILWGQPELMVGLGSHWLGMTSDGAPSETTKLICLGRCRSPSEKKERLFSLDPLDYPHCASSLSKWIDWAFYTLHHLDIDQLSTIAVDDTALPRIRAFSLRPFPILTTTTAFETTSTSSSSCPRVNCARGCISGRFTLVVTSRGHERFFLIFYHGLKKVFIEKLGDSVLEALVRLPSTCTASSRFKWKVFCSDLKRSATACGDWPDGFDERNSSKMLVISWTKTVPILCKSR